LLKRTKLLLRSLRDRLLGLNTLYIRFDALQNEMQAALEAASRVESSLQKFETSGLLKPHALIDKDARKTFFRRNFARSPHKKIVHSGPLVDRIGFLVQSLELRNHFRSVWDHLPSDRFDIILHDIDLEVGTEVFSSWKCNIETSERIIETNTKYRYLVSNHPVSTFDEPLIKRLAITNIRFMYSAGKAGWNLSTWNNLYDIIMCFGPFHASWFARNTEAITVQMGYPRFDDYFRKKVDLSVLQKKYGCDPQKKTVVWLPTWKSLSSVGHFDDEIAALHKNYNVIIKVHPLMPESEPEKIESLKKRHFTALIIDPIDNLALYQLADFMLFDYGGPPLAGIYTDKNMILCNVPGAEHDDLTGEESPDIFIRKFIANVDVNDHGIADLLNKAVIWENQQNERQMLRNLYFAPYLGFSSNVAASFLLGLDNVIGTGESKNGDLVDRSFRVG